MYFPNLGAAAYSVESDESDEYNCAAFAVGVIDERWWPLPDAPDYYWPEGARRDDSLEAFVDGYGQLGFEVCSDDVFELGFEKIAIFADGDEPKHVAVQLEDGTWASKLGIQWEDIHHPTLEALSSPGYGEPALYMRRPRA